MARDDDLTAVRSSAHRDAGAPPRLVTRRGFLGGAVFMGGTAGMAYLTRGPGRQMISVLEAADHRPGTAQLPGTAQDAPPDLVLQVERDVDLTLLDFLFYGFSVDTTTSPTSILATRTKSFLVVRFPPQAIGEGAYYDPNANPGTTGLVFDPPPVLSEVSGSSQLAFRFGKGARIPLPTMTAADLLSWSTWPLHVPPVAQVQGAQIPGSRRFALPVAPGPTDSFIEFPLALYLAPTVFTGGNRNYTFGTTFENRAVPLTSPTKVTDLSYSTLTQDDLTVPGNPPITPELAALWAKDYVSGYGGATFDATPFNVVYYGTVIG